MRDCEVCLIMNQKNLACLNLFLISTALICFEIISTRISSVIFVNNYAFIILSLAILGLGTGGVFSYYKIHSTTTADVIRIISRFVFFTAISLGLFITSVIWFSITNPFVYFPLLFLPFFLAGTVYALIFKTFAGDSFQVYAADLIGAALGSGASIAAFKLFTVPNAVIFLALILFLAAVNFGRGFLKKKIITGLYSIVILGMLLLGFLGHRNILGEVPIGNFPEKDFYYVYPDLDRFDYEIAESRWSLYGRSDLVEYYNQDAVKQIFIDGAAGTPMYRFNGDPQNPGPMLSNILVSQSTTIPFMFLREHEKNNMLVIGPGGGKEVLVGLLTGVRYITGVEVNPDFVDIVKEQSSFNGGIYTIFPNIRIFVKEGRHFIKRADQKYDLVVMALPSTEQLQNIDNLATSENYLLTVEAIQDYLKILTPEGSLIFTVHNRWELIRLIVTTLYAFADRGISNQEALNHFVILGDDYTPTIVIKKNAYSPGEIDRIQSASKQLPPGLASVTYLPYHWEEIDDTIENKLLKTLRDRLIPLRQLIKQDQYDISPVYDDSPYFYKVNRGVQPDYLWLFMGVIFFGIVLSVAPMIKIKRSIVKKEVRNIIYPLVIFISIGIGFMIIEITLFQKLILYLGSPTISLSILLSSLLTGMGLGSFWGSKFHPKNPQKRLKFISLVIILFGVVTFLLFPYLLNELLIYSQALRSIVCFCLMLPLGFLMGIPFPSAIELLKLNNLEKYIPWMYGINGIMSVAGSVSAVILSMTFGFSATFFIGLSLYLIVFLATIYISIVPKKSVKARRK